MKSILSIDIDLNRHHMWSNVHGRVAYNATEVNNNALAIHDVILIEVASDVFYIPPGVKKEQEKSIMVRKTAWMIYNTYLASQIYHTWMAVRKPDSVLYVAPSSDWTCKYPEETRQAMAGVTGQDNHDIRECRTMQYFYLMHPKPWVPFNQHFNSFSFKADPEVEPKPKKAKRK